ncbi:cell division FtsA domain-containing protein [Alkalicoccobacillus murimartini]|uniref:Cell division ATPase FtsA n=1 Tax=Alkalicoccobacillus murimartini TaxID=171685 RepID=A0ABT9YL10_9BACI|nr:cell division FtsA domain-containing protein [Alkalicoccobacillus murimartini]MDQ0208155.1 cell division ATPase FtsA [Alkalicoccobacillus murimartini]
MELDSPTLFALDIGTRSVVGLLLRQRGTQHELIDIEIMEHEERSMLDGQIHNIPAVASVIKAVKNKLEERHYPLEKACVAAAGRSLLTKRATYSVRLDEQLLHTREDLLNLELSAVGQAQYQLSLESDDTSASRYDCVGYSVLEYRLDGTPIGSLLQQNGKEAEIEIIATFLPKVVVESLLQALHQVGLQLEALTLEPIAAIDVLIPASMRRLNVALVDIGAGTSDIALTANGSVQAYGMVPTAGDEITEALSDHYLLDFPEAEKIKRQSLETDKISMTDILGLTTDYTSSELFEPITPSIQHLAHTIANEILELNGKPPKAVMLVGGGSQTPMLPQMLAKALQLPPERVAVRGIDAIQNFIALDPDLMGPELVTPVGIAIAAKQNPIHYVSVQVNDRTLRLFDAKELTIGDAFVSAGIDVVKQYGKPGFAIVVKVNGNLVSIPGHPGKAPTICKNGQPALISDLIKEGDQLTIKKGEDGTPPIATIGDVIEQSAVFTCQVNEHLYELTAEIRRNGQRADLNQQLIDRDEIIIGTNYSLRDILLKNKFNTEWFKPTKIKVDGQDQSILHRKTKLLVNGRAVHLDHAIKQGDHITVDHPDKGDPSITADDVRHHLGNTQQSIEILFNSERLRLNKNTTELYRSSEKMSAETAVNHDDSIVTQSEDLTPFVIQDLFAVTDIQIPTGPNQTFSLTCNQQTAEFTAVINHGDTIELSFSRLK